MNPRIYVGTLDEATFTMSATENASFPLANLSTYFATDLWKSSAATNGQTLKIDFGSARPRNFCIIEGHNFSGMTTVLLQAADDSAYSVNLTTVVTSLVGSANSPLKFEWATAVSKRYWRVLFTDCNSLTPQLGQIFIDQKVDFTQSFDFGFRPKNEDFESVVTKTALSGLVRSAKTFSGRLKFEMGWNNVNNTTLELLRWWMQKVQGGFAPFWYYDELDYPFYVRCGKNFNPATINAYKVNSIATIQMETVSVGQNPYTMQTAAMAVDLDGSTEYASKTSPLNLDMNGAEICTNIGFETNLIGWTSEGNHTGTRITSDFHGGVACAEIVATGAGTPFTNDFRFALPAGTDLTGKKFTLEVWAKSVSGNTSMTMRVNGYSVGYQQTQTITGSWVKYVFNGEFAAGVVGTSGHILFYIAGAGTFRTDDVSITVAHDFTVLMQVKSAWNVASSNDGLALSNSIFSLGLGYQTKNVRFSIGGGMDVNYGAVVNDSEWHLIGVACNRTVGAYLIRDGVMGSVEAGLVLGGKLSGITTQYVGRYAGMTNPFPGQIGEIQIVRGYAMTAAQIDNIYNTTGILKAYDSVNFPGAEVVAHYRWKGTSDTEFLKDETGYNNLTGTNVTQVLDQAIGTYRIAEL
jgi:hypothetical protein